MPRLRKQRRGVLILIVLSLLVLFVLIGTTFIVTAGNYRKASSKVAISDRVGDSPQVLANMAIRQMLRGTINNRSALYGHSLLRDMYGNDALIGQVDAQGDGVINGLQGNGVTTSYVTNDASDGNLLNGYAANSQLVDFDFVALQWAFQDQGKSLPRTGHYNGCVITFLTGEAAGQSTRVLRYVRPNVQLGPSGQILPTPDGEVRFHVVMNTVDGNIQDGDRFIINGRPFSGTGAGYLSEQLYPSNPALRLDPTYNLDYLARINGAPFLAGYLPNYSAYLSAMDGADIPGNVPDGTPNGRIMKPNGAPWDPTNPAERYFLNQQPWRVWTGGMDESYDAADFQNMFLAWVPSNANPQLSAGRKSQPGTTRWLDNTDPNTNPMWDFTRVAQGNALPYSQTNPNVNPNNLLSHLIPTLHRPALVNYWANKVANGGTGNVALGFPDVTDPYMLIDPGHFEWQNLAATSRARQMDSARKLLRAVMPRPSKWDHPNFTGGNQGLGQLTETLGINPLVGPWDVDNDGDGIPDSVWVDLGVPVQQRSDGKLYKPMFAIMCVDMDGKVNINAAGPGNGIGIPGDASWRDDVAGLSNNPRTQSTVYNQFNLRSQPHGDGYGPYEIDMAQIFNVASDTIVTDDGIDSALRISQRYRPRSEDSDGDGLVDLIDTNDDADPSDDYRQWESLDRDGNGALSATEKALQRDIAFRSIYRPGIPGTDDNIGFKNFGLAGSYSGYGYYASLPDLLGRGVMMAGSDGRGVARNRVWNLLQNNEFVDDPYELNLVSPNSLDSPYSYGDLESILRFGDADSASFSTDFSTDRRLNVNAKTVTNALLAANGAITTSSFHVPVPQVQLTEEIRQQLIAEWNMVISSNNGDTLGTVLDRYMNSSVNDTPFFSPTLDGGTLSFADYIVMRTWLHNKLQTTPSNEFVDANLSTDPAFPNVELHWLQQILPFELLHGEKFDINRPFSNGVNESPQTTPTGAPVIEEVTQATTSGTQTTNRNTGRNAVDEPAELSAADLALLLNDFGASLDPVKVTSGARGFSNLMVLDFDGDNRLDCIDSDRNGVLDFLERNPNAAYANGSGDGVPSPLRQMYARHLYCLAMYMLKPDAVIDYDGNPQNNSPGTPNARRETAYAIAQWAVNVVDFRDPDSIMTPFEFDLNPFDGWSVDGNIDPGAAENLGQFAGVVPAATAFDKGVVWGCERPELLITETLAWHDRRTINGTVGGSAQWQPGANPGDPHFDQEQDPQSAFFVELFNPWTGSYDPAHGVQGTASYNPPELYSRDPNDDTISGVQLDRMVTETTNGRTSPVWRLRIDAGRSTGNPNIFNPDIDYSTWMPIREQQFSARLVYFVDKSTINHPDISTAPHVFGKAYNGPTGLVVPGRYAVIGSAGQQATHPGGRTRYVSVMGLENSGSTTAPAHGSLHRRIELIPTVDGYQADSSGTALSNRRQSSPLTIQDIGTSGTPAAITAATVPNTLSEIYPSPDQVAPANPNNLPRFAVVPIEGDSSLFPEGLSISKPVGGYTAAGPQDMPWDDEDGINPLGTTANHSVTYLQRLADPTQPFHPIYNPYRTIDRSFVDLTVFNGVENEDGVPAQSPSYRYASKQRGEAGVTADGVAGFSKFDRSLWPTEPATSTSLVGVATPEEGDYNSPATNMVFKGLLKSSLGYLNDPYRFRNSTDRTNEHFAYVEAFGGSTDTTLGGTNESASPTTDDVRQVGTAATKANRPLNPFPMFTWNNRPFVSHLELAMVPKTSSSQLLTQYELPTNANSTGNLYQPVENPSVNGKLQWNYHCYFNLFDWSRSQYDGGGSGLTRLFDLVHVPSRYAGTEEWFDASANSEFSNRMFQAQNNGNFALNTNRSFTAATFRQPFNKASKLREPGKINLNTISDPRVWNAIAAGNPADMIGYVDWTNFKVEQAVRGGNAGLSHLNPLWPTQFPTPFRDSISAHLIPGESVSRPGSWLTNANDWKQKVAATTGPIYGLSEDLHANESGLLRSTNPFDLATGRLFGAANTQQHLESGRNPYFHMRPTQRLANLTTNRSSVFAVWVTVGYFEVTPWTTTVVGQDENGLPIRMYDQAGDPTVDEAHPDGLMLGAEIGADTGEIERNRAFFIIDRSIPVAFEPGQDHNADDAIVLRRFIE